MVVNRLKPTWRVKVDGQSLDGVLAKRINSITITDAAGIESDQIRIVVSDHQPWAQLEVPPAGAEIECAIGYPGLLRDMGLFVVDRIEVSGPPRQMTITGRASVHGKTKSGKSAITEQRTRSWPVGTKFGDLIARVASDHGLEAAVSERLTQISLPQIDQIDESDINMLTRVGRIFDALIKPAGGRLVAIRRGDSRTTSGEEMPSSPVRFNDVTRWSWSTSLRETPGRVVAIYRDRDAAADIEVPVGEGAPEVRLRERFYDRATAERAAEAEQKRRTRQATQVSMTLPGNPDLVAEAQVTLSGFASAIDGPWLLTRVVHTVDATGYRSEIQAENVQGDSQGTS